MKLMKFLALLPFILNTASSFAGSDVSCAFYPVEGTNGERQTPAYILSATHTESDVWYGVKLVNARMESVLDETRMEFSTDENGVTLVYPISGEMQIRRLPPFIAEGTYRLEVSTGLFSTEYFIAEDCELAPALTATGWGF